MISVNNSKVGVSVTASFSAFVIVNFYASVKAIVIAAVNGVVSVSLSQVSMLKRTSSQGNQSSMCPKCRAL